MFVLDKKKMCLKLFLQIRTMLLLQVFGEVMTTSHYMLCIRHINKNVIARATKFFRGFRSSQSLDGLMACCFSSTKIAGV